MERINILFYSCLEDSSGDKDSQSDILMRYGAKKPI